MCIYVYIHTYTIQYVHVHKYIYVYTYIYICVCTYTCISYIRMYVYVHIDVYDIVQMHIKICRDVKIHARMITDVISQIAIPDQRDSCRPRLTFSRCQAAVKVQSHSLAACNIKPWFTVIGTETLAFRQIAAMKKNIIHELNFVSGIIPDML